MALWISIIELWKSITELWYRYPYFEPGLFAVGFPFICHVGFFLDVSCRVMIQITVYIVS